MVSLSPLEEEWEKPGEVVLWSEEAEGQEEDVEESRPGPPWGCSFSFVCLLCPFPLYFFFLYSSFGGAGEKGKGSPTRTAW